MTISPGAAPVATTRIRMLQSLVLLVLAIIPWPADWEKLRGMVDSARSRELNRSERHAAGYYEGLISGNDVSDLPSGEPSLELIGKPSGWVRFREPGLVHYLDDDFLQFELKPMVRRTLFGQPFLTNAFGMHDDPVTIEKPEGTLRIAVLGSSMDMGWGVRYQDTYINQLQEWLDAHAARKGLSPARRFEVLNFAVAAYSPMQRLETLRRKVLAFHPDLVIYSATTLDTRLMEIHLCEMLRKNVDLKYDFLREVTAVAEASNHDLRVDSEGEIINKKGLKSKLRPLYWGLYDTTLGAIAAECRTAGLPLVMVIIPRVGKADVPSARAEPVARLKAIASHYGLTVFDLSDTFDEFEPATLEIAASDDHPNAVGHRRLFQALARAVVRDQELYHLLFTTDQEL
ncbi:MAG TPA: SGNH/GDSL hydrolase family protein [Isosphaeraceae bacterium]|nr:SGNH/GDSL hydrolase family protein [Isosphaeraceae bacterium]